MSLPDTSSWTYFARTSMCAFYAIEPRILAGVVDLDSKDNAETARANVELSHEYFRKEGAGMIIYFLHGLGDQTAEARRTYQRLSNSSLVVCAALVVDSMLSRAIATFFLGLARPQMPVKLVGSLDDALAWGRPICAEQEKNSSRG